MEEIIKKINLIKAEAVNFSDNANKVSIVCGAIGKSWSGSTLAGHAKFFFRNFEEPKTANRFSIEWGLINGIPDGWEEKSDEEVRSKIETESGVMLDDLKKLAIKLENSFQEIQRDAVLEMVENNVSKSEIEKIEKFSIRSTTSIFNEKFSKRVMTRDTESAVAGYYVASHIYFDAIAMFVSIFPKEVEGFLFELKKINLKKDHIVQDKNNDGARFYVENSIILELSKIGSDKYDLSKLIKLCKELNDNYSLNNYLSCGMILRSILNHVPPIFNKNSFSEIANNYGTKSFKDIMLPLENTARKISDSYLHDLIKKKEILPGETQVNFKPNLDILLSEVIRILKINDSIN